MATVNKRVLKIYSNLINGVDNGGATTAKVEAGYDQLLKTPPDGFQFPMVDRVTQFVRGNVASQDWTKVISLLTGTVGTNVFYQRKSGGDDTTGWIKHTLTNPVIHRAMMNLRNRGYGGVNYDFECKAVDPTKTIADMHAILDSQAAPTFAATARSLEITAAVHGAVNIHHVMGFDFSIALQLNKASNDGDIGYTAVDAFLDGMDAGGSLIFQDATIASSAMLNQTLLTAAAANLVLTVKMSQGAAAKTLTIANVIFGTSEQSPNVEGGYDEFRVPFMIANSSTLPLTLAGTTKVLTIAAVV